MRKGTTKLTGPLTIGICGASHRCGTTTVAFAFANYLCNGSQLWIACVELNNTCAFHSIATRAHEKGFRQNGIDFYPNATLADYFLLCKEGYDAIVIDFGVLNKNTQREFFQTNLPIALGYASPWNQDAFWEWIMNHNKLQRDNNSNIVFMGNLARPEEIHDFSKQHHVPLIPVPYINPFQLTSIQWTFIEEALKRDQYTTRYLFSCR